MHKDEVFKEPAAKPVDFTFNSKVAGVFDDMVNRSVPFYEEIQRMVAELAADHVQANTKVYDLGCSTGTTMAYLDRLVPDNISFIGIDDSEDMLHKCRQKLEALEVSRSFDLQVADLNQPIGIQTASVAVLCLTLQFVRPIHRERLLKNIFDGLVPGGVLIVVEKILAEEQSFNRDFIRYYYDMKRRHHYSEMEIAQKREALENVLVPYKLSENITMLHQAGFAACETFFKWYNFSGFIAKKSS